jgi:hypothetical protein
MIPDAALTASLSLEALGLLAHFAADKSTAQLREEFSEYDIDALVAELMDANFIVEVEPQPIQEPERRGEPNTWVYVIQVGDAFKIGVTKSVKRRLKQFKTHAPSPPVLVWSRCFVDAMPVERRLHSRLRAFWSHGEWFHCDREAIDRALSEYGESET